MFTDIQKKEIIEYLNNTEGTVYLGCDSHKNSRDTADYTVVLIVHINDSKGCKVFGYTEREHDYDKSKRTPRMRLLKEVEKVIEVYTAFEDELIMRNVEIHLDLNPYPEYESNKVLSQARGMVYGYTGIEPKNKPEAHAATYAADHGVRNRWF